MMPASSRYRLSRRRLLSLALIGAAASMVRFPKGAAAAPDPLVRTTLPNGLLVIAEERRSADTVALQLTARAGARDSGDLPGVVLLTSRVMFQGTTRFPSETALQRVAFLVGGTLSRGTSVEHSLFSSVVPSFEADVAFDLLSDIVLNSRMADDALERQRQIAVQDLAQRQVSASALTDELFRSRLFAEHPLGLPIIGTTASIGAISREALLAARQRLWGASNLVLTVVGNISNEEAIAKAQSFFGPLSAGSRNQRSTMALDPKALPATIRGTAGQQQAQFRVGFPAPPQRDRDSYPFTVLDALMDGSSGLIFHELRSVRGLAYSAGSAYLSYQDAGTWFAAAGVDPQNVDAAIDATQSVIRSFRDSPVSRDLVASLPDQVEGLRALADETNAARADRLASQEVIGVELTEELVARLSDVTPADVMRVARDYLQPERTLIVIVGPPART